MGNSPKRAKTKNKYNKLPKENYDGIIITAKEARKLLGKNTSDKMSDEDLARLIGIMYKIANNLIRGQIVPKNEKGV